VLPRKITGSLLKLSSELPEPVLPGEICRRSLVTGTAFMSVTIAGQAKEQRDYDKEVYKERNLVERCFLKLRSYRRIATRYERLAEMTLRRYVEGLRKMDSPSAELEPHAIAAEHPF
jgi:hypothetical protein